MGAAEANPLLIYNVNFGICEGFGLAVLVAMVRWLDGRNLMRQRHTAMKKPHPIIHCCMPPSNPRMLGGAISDYFKGGKSGH